jgi:predicted RNase H-like HicB family nuclease
MTHDDKKARNEFVTHDEGGREMEITVKMAGPLDGAYRAWCPALPGCAVYGRSRHEAKDRIRKVVRVYLENLNVALPRKLVRLSGYVH